MKVLRKTFLVLLIISPLFSITGGNEFSTGLNLAAFLNLPSFNSVNYFLLTVFFFVFVLINGTKSYLNLYITGFSALSMLAFFPRHPSIYAFVGLISIYSCFLVFMHDHAGITKLSSTDEKFLYRVYSFYLIISITSHVVILIISNRYYANDRMMGIFKNPNQMGFFIVAFYLFYILKIRKPEGNLTDYILPLILTGLVILTGSRSALVAILLIHITYFFILRKWTYFILLTIISVLSICIISFYIDNDRLIELISRRDVEALDDVSNMRFQIFNTIINEGSSYEILVGKDTSVGSNGMIYEQKNNDEEIVWLDNLVNVLMYNWGIFGLFFFFTLFIIAIFFQNLPVIHKEFLVTIFVAVASFSFLISDFFPLGFLLVYLKNDLRNDQC